MEFYTQCFHTLEFFLQNIRKDVLFLVELETNRHSACSMPVTISFLRCWCIAEVGGSLGEGPERIQKYVPYSLKSFWDDSNVM